VVIPRQNLSQFLDRKWDGSFSEVWKGIWTASKRDRREVAIKQLKREHQVRKAIANICIKKSY